MRTKWPTEKEVADAVENLKRVQMDTLVDAFNRIVGYCNKHVDCEGCRFNCKKYGCMFMDNSKPPCDWMMPKESEGE